VFCRKKTYNAENDIQEVLPMPPMSILIKPASGSCNLRCRYCFYTDAAAHRASPSLGRMSPETAEILVDRAMNYGDGSCSFVFQGGEPTLRGLDFFRQFSTLVKKHSNPKKLQISYAFQTNGILLDDDWADWFAENHVLVGLSLDGPKDLHDRCRVDVEGRGTFQRVLNAAHLLDRHGVDYNILTVVTEASARSGQKLYQFFQKNGFRYQQYIECLAPLDQIGETAPDALSPARYGQFLKTMFDCWYRDIKAGHYVYNRYFENLMMIMVGQVPESCTMQGVCGPQWVIEADGSVYPCDFYALDQWRLGNIVTDSFAQLEQAREQSGFVAWSRQVPADCLACHWRPLCQGGCRRNREPVTADSTGNNRFCDAYRSFLEYAYPRLTELTQLLRQGQLKF
jgi:uncharacterized protein